MRTRGGTLANAIVALALGFAAVATGTAWASDSPACDDSLPGSTCAPSSLPGSDLPPAAPQIKAGTQGGLFLEGTPVRFAVTVEDDRDAPTALKVAWTFSDGGVGTGLTTRHVFGDVGTYTVRVTVTDTNGNVSFVEESLDRPISARQA